MALQGPIGSNGARPARALEGPLGPNEGTIGCGILKGACNVKGPDRAVKKIL